MKRILDQAVLLLLCLFTLQYAAPAQGLSNSVIALLLALSLCSLSFQSLPSPAWHALSACYLCGSFWLPELLFFAPMVFYCQLFRKNIPFLFLACALALWQFLPDSPALALYLFAVTLAALLLQEHTASYGRLLDTFHKNQDASTESALLLEEKNKALLAKQDSEIYAATLQERNRIAREIHDNVGHMLSRSILMTGALKTANQTPALAQPLDLLEETLSQAMTSIRTSVHDLRDESIRLQSALESLAETFTFCPVTLRYDLGFEVPKEVKYAFITICKEALHNVLRHSNATAVTITVREHPAFYQLLFEDNGTRISPPSGTGCGLANMKERVAALHGTFKIRTENGFRIFITIPKEDNDP